jgi:uncharacterized protein YpuA (DUF1002 family)
MGRRRLGNTIPQKTNNNSVQNLVESEGNESPVADPSRLMIKMSNELKEKELNERDEIKKTAQDMKEEFSLTKIWKMSEKRIQQKFWK